MLARARRNCFESLSMKAARVPSVILGIALVLCPARFLVGQAASPGASTASSSVPAPVPPPPPNPAPTIAPPSLRPIVQPLARPDVAEIQRLTPRIEMWRPNAGQPQIPAVHGRATDHVFVTGTDLMTLWLRFKPTAAGERVVVTAGAGFSLNPPEQVLTVSSSGECVISGQLNDGASRGQIVIRCKLITIRVPVVRAPLTVVQRAEATTGATP